MADDTQCKVCQEWFLDSQTCMHHKYSMGHYQAYEMQFSCGLCICRFETFPALLEHKEATGHWEKPLACDSAIETQSAVSSRCFANPQAGQQHEDNITYREVDRRPFKCLSCECRLDAREACIQHEDATGHGPRPFDCEICHRCFVFQYDLDVHMDADHYPKAFKCETCAEAFRTQDERDLHQESFYHYHRLHCTICDRYYATQGSLYEHLQSVTHRTKSHERQFLIVHVDGITCPFCGKTLATATSLATHLEKSACPSAQRLNREKLWQYYRKCDPQSVFTEPPDNQYSNEQGETVIAWVRLQAQGGEARKANGTECYICHKSFGPNWRLREHMMLSHVGQDELYHCPKRDGCRESKPFGTLLAFFKHVEGPCCAELNLRTVLHTINGSIWPPDTTKEHMLAQILNCIRS